MFKCPPWRGSLALTTGPRDPHPRSFTVLAPKSLAGPSIGQIGARRIETVFIDVGGTLLPNAFTLAPALEEQRQRAVASLLGTVPATSAALIEEIEVALELTSEDLPDSVIERVLASKGWGGSVTARQVRHALCVTLSDVLEPFDHATELLAGVKGLGCRSVVLSNTVLRDAEVYRGDFATLGWDGWVDEYVTSVDVGYSKPDLRIFTSALAVAGSHPSRCVMLGNSEYADIEPAARLGMGTVLVAIEDAAPAETAADACVTRLDDALEVLQRWVGAEM